MKIFWSWQSDTPGNTGRHFVRHALNEAIKQLKEQEDVEEPEDAARLEQLHADADREGVAGSPDLARLIFQKIAASAVVIADVTPIGFGPKRTNKKGKKISPKALMNPNVAIELGYAIAKLPENNFLMVLNTHYGERETIPFDLAHKGGPLIYDLAPDATKEKIKEEHAKLRGQFVTALREFLRVPAPQAATFEEILPRFLMLFLMIFMMLQVRHANKRVESNNISNFLCRKGFHYLKLEITHSPFGLFCEVMN